MTLCLLSAPCLHAGLAVPRWMQLCSHWKLIIGVILGMGASSVTVCPWCLQAGDHSHLCAASVAAVVVWFYVDKSRAEGTADPNHWGPSVGVQIISWLGLQQFYSTTNTVAYVKPHSAYEAPKAPDYHNNNKSVKVHWISQGQKRSLCEVHPRTSVSIIRANVLLQNEPNTK